MKPLLVGVRMRRLRFAGTTGILLKLDLQVEISLRGKDVIWTPQVTSASSCCCFPFQYISFTLTNPESLILPLHPHPFSKEP